MADVDEHESVIIGRHATCVNGTRAVGRDHLPGPTRSPTGRLKAVACYCINSASLRFAHRDNMGAEGYAAYLNQVEDRL